MSVLSSALLASLLEQVMALIFGLPAVYSESLAARRRGTMAAGDLSDLAPRLRWVKPCPPVAARRSESGMICGTRSQRGRARRALLPTRSNAACTIARSRCGGASRRSIGTGPGGCHGFVTVSHIRRLRDLKLSCKVPKNLSMPP